MPRIAVPTAPTPTHTAYDVPTGSDFMAMPSSTTLASIDVPVKTLGHSRVNPSVYLSPMAQAISSKPAMKSSSHAMQGLQCQRAEDSGRGRLAGVSRRGRGR